MAAAYVLGAHPVCPAICPGCARVPITGRIITIYAERRFAHVPH